MHLLEPYPRGINCVSDAIWAPTVPKPPPPKESPTTPPLRCRTVHARERPPYDDIDIPQHPPTPSSIQSLQPARPYPQHPTLTNHDRSDHALDERDTSIAESAEPASRPDIAHQDSTFPSSSSLHLLTLPLEIRQQIYHEFPETFVSTRPLVYGLSPFTDRNSLILSRICRQIRDEALSLFYNNNTWVIKLEFECMYEAFRSWIAKVGKHTTHLRILQISFASRFLPPKSNWSAYTSSGIAPDGQSRPMSLEGQTTFEIDLSEKFSGGNVRLIRSEADDFHTESVQSLVQSYATDLWHKRRQTALTEQDLVDAVDMLLESLATRWWTRRKLRGDVDA